MQRQSLGSPGSRSGGGDFSGGGGGGGGGGAADSAKSEKPIRPLASSAAAASRSSRTVHLVPIATLFCLLVLYLLSHDPSPSDLPASGVERILTKIAVSGSVAGRYLGAGGGGVSAARGLMEERRLRHRKEMAAHVRRS